MTSNPPSGIQWEIRHGRRRTVVVEVGGGLREYTVDGAHVLDGYAVDRVADGGRGQPLLPWPNRLADGQYTFEGQQLQVPIDEVARNNAMHGLTRWLNWRLVAQEPSSIRVGHVVHPRSGYPFTLDLEIEYTLDDSGLSVRTRAHNSGSGPLPFGAGQHPYFSVGTSLVDAAQLQLPVRGHVELDNDRLLPTGTIRPIETTALDYSTPRLIGSAILDDCFCDLVRDADGRARARLSDPASGRGLTVWVGPGYRYLQVFTGDTLAPERRRQGLAIEPMTCPPNAFRTGTDLIVLGPDEAVELEWGVTEGI
ncbi:MAG: aldose 1-epimerase family protein [Chloroflexi bacterium]|nr:aldose 1-epimerase family protein [Chloroflexota bacterium]